MIKTIQIFERNGSNESKSRSGRPKKTNERQRNSLVRNVYQEPSISSNEILSQSLNYGISSRTIRRILYNKGLRSFRSRPKPLLTNRMLKSRLNFANEYKDMGNDFWDRVIYADESYFEIKLSSLMNTIRRFKSSNPFSTLYTKKTVKHPLKIMIWGCFNSRGMGRFHICDGSRTSIKYREVLENYLLSTIRDLNIENPILLDDSAKPHRTNLIKTWLTDNNIESIKWPGNSPDLNPIENLWAILKFKLRRRSINSKRKLIEEVIKIWNYEVDSQLLKDLSDSMQSRIKELLKNKGNVTKY